MLVSKQDFSSKFVKQNFIITFVATLREMLTISFTAVDYRKAGGSTRMCGGFALTSANAHTFRPMPPPPLGVIDSSQCLFERCGGEAILWLLHIAMGVEERY